MPEKMDQADPAQRADHKSARGAEIQTDDAGRITKVIYPDLTMRNFKYDASGALVQIFDRDGTLWKKTGDTAWAQYKATGKPTGQVRAGEITVDENANCIYRDSETSLTWIEQPDGGRVTEAVSGARIETSADGRMATYVAATSRRFLVSSEGFLRYETHDGDSLSGIACDAVCYRHFFEAGYLPPDDEVMTEKRRLSRVTSMDDVREIPAGKMITIKVKVETMTPEVMREVRQITRSMRAAIVEASAAAKSDESADGAEASATAASRPRAPKDTAEMLLPWFSLELEFTDESGALPMVPAELALVEDTAADGAHVTATAPASPGSTAGSAAVPPASKESQPQDSARRIAPWSAKASSKVVTAMPPGTTSVPPASQDSSKRIAPWSSKASPSAQSKATPATPPGTAGVPPASQDSSKRIVPWSTKSATKASVAQPIEEHAPAPEEVRTRIELDARGRVARIEYANETSRIFTYDADGLVLEFQQQNGRVTKRNPDSTWTSYTRDGRQMNVSGKASLVVDREGNLIWEYQQDGSASIQKLDGAVIAINNRGELHKYGSPSDRTFYVTDDGVMKYEVEEEDTLDDIAGDALRAWHWKISFYEPESDEIADLCRLILQSNNLVDAATISEGETLNIPRPDDIALPQFNALQRAVHFALMDTLGSTATTFTPSPRVDKDDQAKVTRVQYPEGTVREFTYGADGDLVEVKHPDGQIHKKRDQDNWLRLRPGTRKADEVEAVRISVDAEGNFTTENVSVGTKLIVTPVGDRMLESKSGWKVTKNSSGLVTAVEYDDKTTREFQYSPDSELSAYRDRNGDRWKRSSAGQWESKKPDGTPGTSRPSVHISVNKDGNFIERSLLNGSKTTESPDRKKIMKYANFSAIEFDLRGRATRFTSKANRTYSISAGGVLLYQVKEGDLLQAIAIDSLFYAHREEVDYKPGADAIEQQCKLIASQNNLDDEGLMQSGDMIVIPAPPN